MTSLTPSVHIILLLEEKLNLILILTKKIIKDLKEGDCLWMSAFTYHGFSGDGSLLKISDGQNINYLEKEDLINTYKLNDVLKRTKNDIQNWGHDEK